MSPVKISAIKTHIPAISRISASTAHLNSYIVKHSKRSLSRGFSDETDDENQNATDDDQIMADVDWDESENHQSDDETPTPQRTEPTDIDSASEDEEPAPPKPSKPKTVKSVKGEKPAEKPPKKQNSAKKQAKSDDEEPEPAPVKPKSTKKPAPAPKADKKVKTEEKAPKKPQPKKPAVKPVIAEETASIGFDEDENDAKVMEKSKKSEDSDEKSNKRTKPKVEDKESASESKNARVRRPQKPNIKPKSGKKGKAAKPEFKEAIDRDIYKNYRELIAPFFDDVNVGSKTEPDMVSVEDRYTAVDNFYRAARQLAKKIRQEAGDDYSKHNLQIVKDEKRKSVLKYIDGDTKEEIESGIEGSDALKFFRMNPLKKQFDDDAVMEYLKGDFIDTVNILAVNTKPLSLLDYDRLTQFSFYNDVEYAKEANIEFNMPKYVDLIKNLHKWTLSMVFEARSNFLALIPESDREKLWNDAVKRFDEYNEQDFEDDRVIAIMEIFSKLMHSRYFKEYLLNGAVPNALFAKVFRSFLDTPNNKNILIELFTGPLESIGFLFTPIYFDYRGVEYNGDESAPTFNDLVKIVNDPDLYDPRTAIWITKLV